MFLRCLVYALALTVYQLSPSAPAVFPGTNYARTCPFPPLDWKWCGLPLQGRHHHYTHISVRDSASTRGPPSPQSWRNDNYDIHPLNRHEIVQLPCPLFQPFFSPFFFFDWFNITWAHAAYFISTLWYITAGFLNLTNSTLIKFHHGPKLYPRPRAGSEIRRPLTPVRPISFWLLNSLQTTPTLFKHICVSPSLQTVCSVVGD